jgi:hypothetical protein
MKTMVRPDFNRPLGKQQKKKKQQTMNKATVRLTFTMQYGCELSQAESKPSVLCYFSDHIANKPVDVAVEEDNAARQITVTIEGSIDPRKPLPVDAELVFRATCWTPNDFGIECRVEAGMGTIPLNEIVVAAASTGRYSRDIPLVEKCVGGREKGRVRIISVKKQVCAARRSFIDNLPARFRSILTRGFAGRHRALVRLCVALGTRQLLRFPLSGKWSTTLAQSCRRKCPFPTRTRRRPTCAFPFTMETWD